MSELPPAQRRRRLSRGAFLVLWGGWSFSACLCLALWMGDGTLRAEALNRILALAQILVTWLGLAWWELSFRRRYLSPQARRPWLAWFVLVPLTLSALFLIYGPVVHRRLPGTYENNTEFTYLADVSMEPPITPEKIKAERDARAAMPTIVLQMRSRKSNWGLPQRAVRFGESRLFLDEKEEDGPVWIIDPKGKTAHQRGQQESERNLDEEGWRHVLSDMAGASYTDEQLEVIAKSMDEYLSIRGLLPPRLRLIPELFEAKVSHLVRGDAGVIGRPWLRMTAGLFVALMFPVTWLTVRRTMFPPTHETHFGSASDPLVG